SKGRINPRTAMWLRDATVHNRMPDLRKLTRDPYYFPYRYGQALLAYIGGRFGDDAVVRLFLAAGSVGPEAAFERATGIPARQIFTDWQESAREMYNPVVEDRPFTLGSPLIGSKRGIRGYLNLGPAYSPDGHYIAFLSTRDVFDIDLFLADARTGQVGGRPDDRDLRPANWSQRPVFVRPHHESGPPPDKRQVRGHAAGVFAGRPDTGVRFRSRPGRSRAARFSGHEHRDGRSRDRR